MKKGMTVMNLQSGLEPASHVSDSQEPFPVRATTDRKLMTLNHSIWHHFYF